MSPLRPFRRSSVRSAPGRSRVRIDPSPPDLGSFRRRRPRVGFVSRGAVSAAESPQSAQCWVRFAPGPCRSGFVSRRRRGALGSFRAGRIGGKLDPACPMLGSFGAAAWPSVRSAPPLRLATDLVADPGPRAEVGSFRATAPAGVGSFRAAPTTSPPSPARLRRGPNRLFGSFRAGPRPTSGTSRGAIGSACRSSRGDMGPVTMIPRRPPRGRCPSREEPLPP
jgi:hypothetical protein